MPSGHNEAGMTQDGLGALRDRWLATGSFQDEQAYLAARVRLKDVRFVYLDPDGTLPDWMAIVVRFETGIVYGTQCAGVVAEQRFIEGYYVPVGGATYDVEEGKIEVGPFVDVFHEKEGCQWGWTGRAMPTARLAQLSKLVGSVPYWFCKLDGTDQKYPLRLDAARLEQLAEAWIPVETPNGPGVLVYQNCD